MSNIPKNFDFTLNNSLTESTIDNLVYDVISKIPSLTGPTGPVANVGILTTDGILLSDITPETTNTFNLGSSSFQFNGIYSNTIYINNIPINSSGGTIQLPAGTMVGGVPMFTIRIIGQKNFVSELPLSATLGDAYLIDANLWVYNSSNVWVDIGSIRGPAGLIGPTGYTGPTGPTGYTGYT